MITVYESQGWRIQGARVAGSRETVFEEPGLEDPRGCRATEFGHFEGGNSVGGWRHFRSPGCDFTKFDTWISGGSLRIHRISVVGQVLN